MKMDNKLEYNFNNIKRSTNYLVPKDSPNQVEDKTNKELSNLKSSIYFLLTIHHILGIISLPFIVSLIASLVALVVNGPTTIPVYTFGISIVFVGLTILSGLNLRAKYMKLKEIDIPIKEEVMDEPEIIDIPESHDKVKDINLKLFSLIKPKLDRPVNKRVINDYTYGSKRNIFTYEEPILTKTR